MTASDWSGGHIHPGGRGSGPGVQDPHSSWQQHAECWMVPGTGRSGGPRYGGSLSVFVWAMAFEKEGGQTDRQGVLR